MIEHTVNLTAIEADNFPVFSFKCHHHPAAEKWACVVDEGDMEPDPTMVGVCWLWTWWDAIGAEMLDLRSENFFFPLPIMPQQPHGFGSEPTLVVDYQSIPLWQKDGDAIDGLIHWWDEMKRPGRAPSGAPYGAMDRLIKFFKECRA